MLIDIFVMFAIIMALVKGYSKGLIMALFNTIALIIGLAVAIKFSSLVSPIIRDKFEIGGHYAPFIAFVLVYLAVIIVIRVAGKAVEKTLESIKVGLVNRMGGVALYLILYLAITSIILFYLNKMGFLSEDQVARSVSYPWIAPWGPTIIDGLGYVIPFFKNMFDELNDFFDQLT
jgi:membrane protein required for colicin V production